MQTLVQPLDEQERLIQEWILAGRSDEEIAQTLIISV